MSTAAENVQSRLETALTPEHLEIRDDSAQHAGHRGDRAHGGAHLFVTVVTAKFDDLSLVERHRLVYAAVDDLLKQEVHALSMQTMTPAEWAGR